MFSPAPERKTRRVFLWPSENRRSGASDHPKKKKHGKKKGITRPRPDGVVKTGITRSRPDGRGNKKEDHIPVIQFHDLNKSSPCRLLVHVSIFNSTLTIGALIGRGRLLRNDNGR